MSYLEHHADFGSTILLDETWRTPVWWIFVTAILLLVTGAISLWQVILLSKIVDELAITQRSVRRKMFIWFTAAGLGRGLYWFIIFCLVLRHPIDEDGYLYEGSKQRFIAYTFVPVNTFFDVCTMSVEVLLVTFWLQVVLPARIAASRLLWLRRIATAILWIILVIVVLVDVISNAIANSRRRRWFPTATPVPPSPLLLWSPDDEAKPATPPRILATTGVLLLLMSLAHTFTVVATLARLVRMPSTLSVPAVVRRRLFWVSAVSGLTTICWAIRACMLLSFSFQSGTLKDSFANTSYAVTYSALMVLPGLATAISFSALNTQRSYYGSEAYPILNASSTSLIAHVPPVSSSSPRQLASVMYTPANVQSLALGSSHLGPLGSSLLGHDSTLSVGESLTPTNFRSTPQFARSGRDRTGEEELSVPQSHASRDPLGGLASSYEYRNLHEDMSFAPPQYPSYHK